MQSLLKKLGISDENPGVFCGEWLGSGPVIEKFSPIDGNQMAVGCDTGDVGRRSLHQAGDYRAVIFQGEAQRIGQADVLGKGVIAALLIAGLFFGT